LDLSTLKLLVCFGFRRLRPEFFDIAAKRHKKNKNKISGLVISKGYNEKKHRKSDFL
jgi:hypothetical protein